MNIICYLLPIIYNFLLGETYEIILYLLSIYSRYMGFYGNT